MFLKKLYFFAFITSLFMQAQEMNNDVWNIIISQSNNHSRNVIRATNKTLKELSSINNINLYCCTTPLNLTKKQKTYALMLATYNNNECAVINLLGIDAQYDTTYLPINPHILMHYKSSNPLAKKILQNTSPSLSGELLTAAAYFGDNEKLHELFTSTNYKITNRSSRSQQNSNNAISTNDKLYATPYAALYLAAHNGHEETVRLLLQKIPYIAATISSELCKKTLHRYNIVEILLQHHPNINEKIQQNNGSFPILYVAVENNLTEIVRVLCNYPHIDINGSFDTKEGRMFTPLSMAVEHGDISIIKMLLKHPKCLIDGKDPKKKTPLLFACQNGHKKIVQLLLAKGANYNILTEANLPNKYSCLYVATFNQHHSVMNLLLKKAPHLNNVYNPHNNCSPLHQAVTNNDITGVTILLQSKGINPNIISTSNKTPLDLAYDNNNKDLISLLKSHGATRATAQHSTSFIEKFQNFFA